MHWFTHDELCAVILQGCKFVTLDQEVQYFGEIRENILFLLDLLRYIEKYSVK
jgi:hypothetical protein